MKYIWTFLFLALLSGCSTGRYLVYKSACGEAGPDYLICSQDNVHKLK